LPKINYSNFYAAFHALELNHKIDAYCRSKVKSRVVIYYDPLNSNVSKVLDFIQPVEKHSFLVLGLERSLEDASQVDLIITDRMLLQLLEGLIGNYTLPLYRNHGRMELEKQGIHGLELAQYQAFDHLINLAISSRIGTQQLGLKTVPEALYPWQNTAAFQLVEQRLAVYEQDKKKSFEVFYRELLNELISGVAAGTIELY
ncbi:MAG: hypothetical protein KBS98_03000, partial [Flavobacterium sp.]|nr:hypothetical protein [Candidatus Neoflavobacterium equi]